MFYPDRNRRKFFKDFFDEFNDKFFDDFFSLARPSQGRLCADLVESDKEYSLTIEIPGLEKEDIKISYENNYLTISAEKKAKIDESDEKQNYVHKEIYYGSYHRSFFLEDVDSENIKASYKNGILVVKLPKKEVIDGSKYIEIE
ncbi:MAG TPA: Hsp20/alpha crystallin family protein [Acholeplasmataceae bacterium]|nr:Hsp20/alpha crystallin family protein [Acholeplasmataceae bacterium]